jgi:RHS repeat-associated protein
LGNVLVTISDNRVPVDDGTYEALLQCPSFLPGYPCIPCHYVYVKANPATDGVVDRYTAVVITANDYFPFGMLMPGRKYSSDGTYRYGFNGKENDNEVKGEGNQQDYGMRIYDPRVGRFLSVDPITASYPELTPYQFASNRPVDGIDLDGLEFFSANVFKRNTPGRIILYNSVKVAQKIQRNWNNSRAGKFTNGLINTTAGVIGTIGSITYITKTGGTGAALGGGTALMLSLGEIGIGVAQMVDAIAGKQDGSSDVLHNSSSIPGLIAYSTNSKIAPFIDAFGQFSPTLVTSLGEDTFKLLFSKKNFLGVNDALKKFTDDPTILQFLSTLDHMQDVSGVVINSAQIVNGFFKDGRLKWQKLVSNVTYTVKKNDNLTEIARLLNTTIEELAEQNNIEDVNKIKVGQKITYSKNTYGAKRKK